MTNKVDCFSILHSAPDLYLILNPELIIVEVSDAYLKATMVKRENIIGQKLFDIFPANPEEPTETGTKNLLKSLQIVLQHKIEHCMAIQKYDIRRPASEGGKFVERYWTPTNTPVLDKNNNVKYIIHRVEDVTEMVHLKQMGLENSQRLQLLLENIKDYAIYMLDSKGNIISWNIGAEAITGYKAEEVLGRNFKMFLAPEDIARKKDKYELKNALKTGRYEAEAWRMRKDGTGFWANVVMTSIHDIEGNFVGFGKVTRDLTIQKQMEQVKSEFISVVNHELRTPLTSVIASIQLLQNTIATQSMKKTQKLLTIANSNCDRLMRLINDILDIERLEIDKINLSCKPHELGELISEAVFLNQIYADKYKIKLVYRPISGKIFVNVDIDRMIQVLTNLISNAVKFSFKDSPVTIKVTKLHKKIRVAVTNFGEGIPDYFKDRIFKKFAQADISARKGGTGLGLAISKDIIEGFGGQLKFTSVPNKETVFCFELPILNLSKK